MPVGKKKWRVIELITSDDKLLDVQPMCKPTSKTAALKFLRSLITKLSNEKQGGLLTLLPEKVDKNEKH